jgi:hypothetical protein
MGASIIHSSIKVLIVPNISVNISYEKIAFVLGYVVACDGRELNEKDAALLKSCDVSEFELGIILSQLDKHMERLKNPPKMGNPNMGKKKSVEILDLEAKAEAINLENTNDTDFDTIPPAEVVSKKSTKSTK